MTIDPIAQLSLYFAAFFGGIGLGILAELGKILRILLGAYLPSPSYKPLYERSLPWLSRGVGWRTAPARRAFAAGVSFLCDFAFPICTAFYLLYILFCFNSGKLRISLVRAVETNAYGAPDTSKGIHYWIDGNAYMALTTGKTVEQSFYHNLSHILDTFVYSNSIHYDFWNDNNPEGFHYDECYTEYTAHADSPWLNEDDRAFIDAYSMTFDYEDRATVMEYALTEGMEHFFTSDTMQAKLNQLCMGIRQAFGWRKYEGTFPWEQYLQESLAYVKDK